MAMNLIHKPVNFLKEVKVELGKVSWSTREELIASSKTVEETRRYLNADSLAYLSLEGLLRCVHPRGAEFCNACFTGDYPMPIHRVEPQLSLFQENRASEHRA